MHPKPYIIILHAVPVMPYDYYAYLFRMEGLAGLKRSCKEQLFLPYELAATVSFQRTSSTVECSAAVGQRQQSHIVAPSRV